MRKGKRKPELFTFNNEQNGPRNLYPWQGTAHFHRNRP